MMSICGAQGRIKDKEYLHDIYCEVKNRIQRGNKSYDQMKMCTYTDMVNMVRWILGRE
jgi:hypothetical protein